MEGLANRSHKPRSIPHQMPAIVEAAAMERRWELSVGKTVAIGWWEFTVANGVLQVLNGLELLQTARRANKSSEVLVTDVYRTPAEKSSGEVQGCKALGGAEPQDGDRNTTGQIMQPHPAFHRQDPPWRLNSKALGRFWGTHSYANFPECRFLVRGRACLAPGVSGTNPRPGW